MRKSLYISLLLMLLTGAVFSQRTENHCAIHFDKSIYVAGDTAWFHLFLPQIFHYNNSLARVVFLNAEKETVEDFFLPILDEMSSGYYAIPKTLETGIYQAQVILYEKDSQRDLPILTYSISILNPEALPEKLEMSIPKSLAAFGELKVSLDLEQDTIQAGGKVLLHIQVEDSEGNPIPAKVSLSVSEAHEQKGFAKIAYAQIKEPTLSIENNLVLKGKISYSGNALKQRDIVAFHQETGESNLLHTDLLGQFKQAIVPFTGKRTVQFWDLFDLEIDTELDPIKDKMPSGKKRRVVHTSEFDSLISLHKQRQKIQQHFSASQVSPPKISPALWKHIPDYTVRTEDFEPFPDLVSFLETIRTPLKIKRKKEKLIPKMLNPIQKPFFKEPPVFMVDNVLCTFSEVLALKLNEITQLDFYNEPASLRPLGILARNGLVVIHSSLENKRMESNNSWELNGLQEKISYPRHMKRVDTNHIPRLNSLIYWNPEIETNQAGKVSVSFYHSDEIGRFSITVLLRSENGKMGTKSSHYVVEF